MNKRKVYWHEAHYEAIKLDLHQYSDSLSLISEYQLTQKALIMDVLIIKKDPDVVIIKNIGRIFRAHNIVEYKSEWDSLGVGDYNKVLAYALLYSSFEKVPLEDMTVTFSLTVRPQKLFKYLKNVRRLGLDNAGDGITYIMGDVLPVQVIESKKLPKDENPFIEGLRSGIKADKLSEILKKYDGIVGLDMRNVYIDRLIQANKDAFKEVSGMSKELKRILTEVVVENGWLAEREQEAAALATKETVRETARKMLSYGDPFDKIAAVTELSVEEVMELANTPAFAL